MQVYKISSKNGYSNSFVVTKDGKDGILIDCAEPSVLNECDKLGIKIDTILLTHGHFDHVCGCRVFAESEYAGIYCSKEEKPLIFSREYLGIFGGVSVSRFEIDRELSDGDEFELCGMKVKMLSTPGHSAGSVCYIIGDMLFTGDTLFKGAVGRWDLPTGSYSDLRASLKKLKDLDCDYKIYCGHGEDSTLGYERKTNPYLRSI